MFGRSTAKSGSKAKKLSNRSSGNSRQRSGIAVTKTRRRIKRVKASSLKPVKLFAVSLRSGSKSGWLRYRIEFDPQTGKPRPTVSLVGTWNEASKMISRESAMRHAEIVRKAKGFETRIVQQGSDRIGLIERMFGS